METKINNGEYFAVCENCGSENVYFSKKQQCFVCEDCGGKFTSEESNKSLRIFLSYGHDESAAVVEEIRKMLLEKGHNPWVDKFEIKGGSDWRSQITNGILGSDDFLAFITNHSIRKPGVCLDEIAIALGTRNCQIQSVLLEKNATVPSSISTKQWTDLSEWKIKLQQGEKIWKQWLSQKTDEIVAAIENPSNTKKSFQLSLVNQTLRPITPEIKLKQLLAGEIIARDWLFQKVREWYESNSKCLLLIASPGAGKSVFCAQLSHYMSQCAGLYLLEWNNAESRNLNNLLVSLLFQLCCNIDDFREKITEEMSCVEDFPSEDFILTHFLLNPLNSLIDGDREHKFVIIDAIDEFEDDERHKAFSQIKRLVENSPKWLRWVITSRPTSDSLQSYFNASTLTIDEYQEFIQDDIRAFCKSYLDDNEKTEKVIAKSNGSFVYAKELVETMNQFQVDLSDLNKLPTSLSAVYMANFSRALNREKYLFFKPFISLILVIQEPIKTTTLKHILCIDADDLTKIIDRLKSFLNIGIDIKGQQLISVYHKSFSDWLYSRESSPFRINKEEAHHIIAKYIVNNMESVENDEYLSKYAYTHLRNAKEWVTLEYKKKQSLLLSCITASDRYGNLDYENHYLTIYQEELGEDIPFLMSKMHYLQKTNSNNLEAVAAKLLLLCDDCVDETMKFEAKVNTSMALFYAGKDTASHQLLVSIRAEYEEKFMNNDKYSAMYAHALSLSSHDFDYNDDVVDAATISAHLHNKQNNSYKYFVALVNKFDALMGCGKIYEAYTTAMTVFRLNEEKYFVHIDDILQICYANLLQTSGRVMESLYYYERGLGIAKKIHKWDYLYGSIWRELAIARFGDNTCLKRIELNTVSASEANYKYLVSLGNCFYVLSVYLLNLDVDHNPVLQEKLRKVFGNVLSCGYQGHVAQVKAAAYLRGWGGWLEQSLEYADVMLSLISCQGVKGCPDVINSFLDLRKEEETGQQWGEKYLSELIRYKQSYYANNISVLSTEPLLYLPNCGTCEAKCCYDGAYLERTEADIIEKFVVDHQDRFEDLPQNFIVQGTWTGLEHLKKTATKEFDYKGDYPKHFNKTRCVFCNDEGLCSLQVVATDLQMHPWAVKPRACWSFPIHGVRDGKIISPPKLKEPDPNNIGPEYPGYVTFLPCGKAQIRGKSWKDIYKNEIEYYIYLMKSGKL